MLQIFKKSRNNWVNTVFNFNRDDACTAAFDPTEIWHSYIVNIPVEDRTCPVKKGVSKELLGLKKLPQTQKL